MFRPTVFVSTLVLLSASGCQVGSSGGQGPSADVPRGRTTSITPTRQEPLIVDGFASNAFPPTLPDSPWHRTGWDKNDCLRCHETGVQQAPRVVHDGMPPVLLEAKCRTCHVLVPGQKPRGAKALLAKADLFAPNAFPPMIPNSGSHQETWMKDDCMLCHDSGIRDAPIVRPQGMPRTTLQAKCRTCHVQVRAVDSVWKR